MKVRKQSHRESDILVNRLMNNHNQSVVVLQEYKDIDVGDLVDDEHEVEVGDEEQVDEEPVGLQELPEQRELDELGQGECDVDADQHCRVDRCHRGGEDDQGFLLPVPDPIAQTCPALPQGVEFHAVGLSVLVL